MARHTPRQTLNARPSPSKNRENQTPTPQHNEAGVVIANHGAHVDVESSHGIIHRCSSKKRLGTLVCGDQVLWEPGSHQTGVVIAIEARRTVLTRPDAYGKLKPVAANIDQLIVTLAPESAALYALESDKKNSPPLLLCDTIDRYLVAAEVAGIHPLIVINKIEGISAAARHTILALLQPYLQIGYHAIFTSVRSGEGIAELTNHLGDKTSVFVGQSGVGKSSLIDLFLPHESLRVGTLSGVTGQGRHTTTTATLYHIAQQGRLIDSPGVREFGLWNIEAEKIASAYVEFRSYLGQCKFNNCQHLTEPGCAILHAVRCGDIDPRRLTSYHQLITSLGQPR